MTILSAKPDHDGSIALIQDGKLVFSIEQEKDSRRRHSHLALDNIVHIIGRISSIPDVIALSGWRDFQAGYYGLEAGRNERRPFWGKSVDFFSSSHERSHILCAYGMSPFEQGKPCYVLLWEGTIGKFYKIDEKMRIMAFPSVLNHPGVRYSYIYYLANPNEQKPGWWETQSMAGKLMALAGWDKPVKINAEDRELAKYLLSVSIDDKGPVTPAILAVLPGDKNKLAVQSSIINGGLETETFRSFAHYYSNELFDIFYRFAKANLREGLPLLITGGCGLNCEWNTKWKHSGLFNDVFVPPCPNDAGSAIGTAIDAQLYHTGNAKIEWTVYCGEDFCMDRPTSSDWAESPLDDDQVARLLHAGQIVAWVQGRYEIGPRALGNRSMLASPFSKEMTARLNRLKHRENYRPIAPICLEEDVSLFFNWAGSSPYMLHFQKVKDGRISAVTHDDGSARVQTVTEKSNLALYQLLLAFKRLTGIGVLCNTSLNFLGKGFINKKSDLLTLAAESEIRVLVINSTVLVKTGI